MLFPKSKPWNSRTIFLLQILNRVVISEVFEFPILFYTQNRKLGNLGKYCFTSNFDSSSNLRCKNNKKLTATKTQRSRYAFRRKKENFRDFPVSILPYTQNRKLENLGKCSFTLNFDISCNLNFRNDKNELRQKLKGQDK